MIQRALSIGEKRGVTGDGDLSHPPKKAENDRTFMYPTRRKRHARALARDVTGHRPLSRTCFSQGNAPAC